MKTSLKLLTHRKNNKGESPLFVRVRGKNSQGKFVESSINTDLDIDSKHFDGGVLKSRTPNYTNKQRIINSMIDLISSIIGESKEEGLEPTPQYIKVQYEKRKELKQIRTEVETPEMVQNHSFWKVWKEYWKTKKNTSYGYRKTINTTKNHLKGFEEYSKRTITFDYIIFKTIVFQGELNDYLWNQKNHSNSYLNKLYDNLSGFLYFSHQMGYIKRKPKLKVEPELEKDEKIYLNTEEIIKLFNWRKFDYEPKKEKELLENKHIRIIEQTLEGTNSKNFGGVLKVTNWELVKYIFLFQNCIGCRIGDIPYFKVSNMNFDKKSQLLSWTQQKTDKRVQVPLNDMGGFIFKKFSSGKSRSQTLFPSVSQSKFNKQLKNLCEESGFLNRLVSNPKRVGSDVINTKEKPLWELISSHGGRRGFVKNSIDLGKMDYRTIMKLSGHKTFSEFSKYISVTSQDVLKIQDLYKVDNKTKSDKGEYLVNGFNKLTDDEQKILIGVLEGLMRK
jgi:integrase|tara:strand:+ start:165 stop:1673 length:1509 start_codon:yes stop_codon:yes gene_type:complete